MAPQRFASARYKSRPAARVPFRDDTSLVAFRYEQTVQAKPPILIVPPPRNPARQQAAAVAAIAAAAAAAAAATTSRPFSTLSSSPLVIVPPAAISPEEQHPAFRTSPTSIRPIAEEVVKRDSVLAPTASSVTIRGGEDDDDHDHFTYGKHIGDDVDITISSVSGDGPPSVVSIRWPTNNTTISTNTTTTTTTPSSRSETPDIPVELARLSSPPCGDYNDEAPPRRPTGPSPPRSPSPTRPTAARETSHRRLAKNFSFRSRPSSSLSKRRLRKKSVCSSGSSDDNDHDRDHVHDKGNDGIFSRASSRLGSPKSPKPKMSGPGAASARSSRAASPTSPADPDFTPINTAIPTDSLIDDDVLTALTFSKRGSLMFGGKRLAPSSLMMENDAKETATSGASIGGAGALPPPSTPPTTTNTHSQPPDDDDKNGGPKPKPAPTTVPSIRVMPIDVERESQKVRSLYESGDDGLLRWEDGRLDASPGGGRLEPTAEVPSDEEEKVASPSSDDHLSPDPASSHTPRSASSLSQPRDDSVVRSAFERAGGIEDWEDVDGADVDRYGFISVKRPTTSSSSRPQSSSTAAATAAATGYSEASPSLLHPTMATPPRRKRNVLVKRQDSTTSSSPLGPGRTPGRKISARSLNTQASDLSTASRRSTRSSIRAAANLLPHNRDRRWVDEAGDMLTLTPGLADIQEDEQVGKISEALKKKEWERSEKWRKMARVVRKGGKEDGQGMDFDFDPKHPKLVDRTWKGIPDRWRAAAWYSFLASSAKRSSSSGGGGSGSGKSSTATDAEITAAFQRLQGENSPDDVQIDLDVPRTINRHIMFRKRYRGGQRLLFRVLHALSLYFPDTGYVQGMASLAATLLCYYDEEKCFVMLVRMWQLRGLEQLYQPGFGCLMTALKDFEKHWLDGKEISRKLTELNIDATAYGTRWYLTLFNLSVPFPAQLRIWDVFMLLGESPPPTPTSPPEQQADSSSAADATKVVVAEGPMPGLDVLHATSAALIHGLRDVLLDSDFENAMKALTSWVPIKDEELLMKVTRAEWKLHQQQQAKGKRS